MRTVDEQEREAWQRLGLEPGPWSADQVQAAWRARAAEVHPDRTGDRAAWDALQEAYALLAEGGQHLATGDELERPGAATRLVRMWRSWRRPPRVAVVALIGAVLVAVVAVPLWLAPRVPWQAPAMITGWLVGWWVWAIGREIRRPARRPELWVLRFLPGRGATIRRMRDELGPPPHK